MKRLLTLSLLAFALVISAAAQPSTLLAGLVDQGNLPANFAAFGVGIQGGTNLNGGSAFCHAVTGVNYLCARVKYSGSTTSNTVELKQVVFARAGLVGAINGNAGVATGADGGTGGAFAVGGSLLYNVSRLPILKAHPGFYLGVSGDWDKRDVKEFTSSLATVASARPALRAFTTKGVYDFFVGYAWGK